MSAIGDIIDRLAYDIRDGKTPSLSALFAGLEQFDTWNAFVQEHKNAVAECLLVSVDDPAAGIQRLSELVTKNKNVLTAPEKESSLPQLRNPEGNMPRLDPTTAPIREKKYESYLEKERQKNAAQIRKYRKMVQDTFKKYHESFFTGLPATVQQDKKIQQEIQEIEKNAGLKSFEDIRNELVAHARKYKKEQEVQEINTLVEQYAPEMNAPEMWSPIQNARTTAEVLVAHPDIASTDVVSRAVESGSTAGAAARYSRAYEAVAQTKNPSSNMSQSNTQKVIIETIYNNAPQEHAEVAAAELFRRVAQEPEKLIEGITRRIGTELVDTGFIEEFIRQGNNAMSQKSGGGGTGLLKEFAGTLLSEPATEDMRDYLTALYQRARVRADAASRSVAIAENIPSPTEFLIVKARADAPHYFHVEPGESPLSWLLQWIFGKAGQKTAVVAGKKVAAKGIFGKLFTGGLAKAVGLSSLPAIAVSFGGEILSFVGKLFIGGVSRAGNAISSYAADAANAKPKPDLLSANGWIFPAVIIFFMLMTVMPTVSTWEKARKFSGLPVAVGGGGISESGQMGTPIDCTKPPDMDGPACKLSQCEGDCAWPLDSSTHACIIEGPFVGTHESCRLSGIDFITLGNQNDLFGAPVYTPIQGVVVDAVFGYLDNSGFAGNKDGGTYGNHVKVRVTKDGSDHILLFAHLRNIQLVQKGQSIEAKTAVGFVDHTGYSLGVHLHYEDWTLGCPRKGVDINKFTPFPVPTCGSYSDCSEQLQKAGHSACL